MAETQSSTLRLDQLTFNSATARLSHKLLNSYTAISNTMSESVTQSRKIRHGVGRFGQSESVKVN